MTQHYLADVHVLEDISFVVVLAYIGCEIYSIEKTNGRLQFRIVIPELDLKQYQQEFNEGHLAIADARAFGTTHAEVMRKIKTAHADGQWINSDLFKYARDTGFRVA